MRRPAMLTTLAVMAQSNKVLCVKVLCHQSPHTLVLVHGLHSESFEDRSNAWDAACVEDRKSVLLKL